MLIYKKGKHKKKEKKKQQVGLHIMTNMYINKYKERIYCNVNVTIM